MGYTKTEGKGEMKKYTIYMANNDVQQVTRSPMDWWMRDLGGANGMLAFRTQDGKILRVSKHFLLKIEDGWNTVPNKEA